jgi:hypothetical protein
MQCDRNIVVKVQQSVVFWRAGLLFKTQSILSTDELLSTLVDIFV